MPASVPSSSVTISRWLAGTSSRMTSHSMTAKPTTAAKPTAKIKPPKTCPPGFKVGKTGKCTKASTPKPKPPPPPPPKPGAGWSRIVARQPVANPSPMPAWAAPKGDGGWMARHQGLAAQAAGWTGDVVLMGDSITDLLGNQFKSTQDKWFGKYNPLNLGIGGDTTPMLMWRLANGEFPRHAPKACIILIGTNDLSVGVPPPVIAQRLGELVKWIWDRWTQTLIVVQHLYPRQFGATNDVGSVNRLIKIDLPNVIVSACGDNLQVIVGSEYADGIHPAGPAYDRVFACLTPSFV